MSDPEAPTPPPSEDPAKSAPSEAKPAPAESAAADVPEKTKKKGRWFRRLRVLILLLLFLAVLSRAVIVILLPPVLRHVAGYYGLDASYERLELSVLGGDTSLWHLVIKPKDSTEPLAVIDYCRGDISPLNLLRGRLDVWRVEADGVHVALDRNADGNIPLLKLIAQNAPTSSAPTPAAKAAASGKVDLTPPLRLDALRLSHIRLRIRDKAVTPAFDSTVAVDLRLSDLGGAPGRPTEFSADVDADPFLDALHVTGEGHTEAGAIDATFKANMNGLRLRPLAPYLAALGLRPMANETSLRAAGELKLGPAPGNSNLATATLKLDNLMLLDDGEEAAALDQLTLEAPALDPHRIGLNELKLDNVRVQGRRAANGNVRFAGLEYIGAPPSTQPAKPAAPAAPAATYALPIIDLPLIAINNFSAKFHDDAISPATDLSLLVDNLAVKKILIDPAHPEATVTIAGLAHVPGIAQNVHLDGTVQPMAAKRTLAMHVGADQIALHAIKPYLDQIGVVSTIDNATFNATVSAEISKLPEGPAISAAFKDIKLTQGNDLVAMDHLSISNARFGKAFEIDDISVAGPKLGVSREADGSLAAAGLNFNPKRIPTPVPTPVVDAPVTTAPTTAPATTLSIPPIPSIIVKHFKWSGIDITYDDRAMSPALHTQISDAGAEYDNGKIHAWLKAPKVIDSLELNGSVDAIPDGARVQAKFATAGVDSSIVTPLLQPLMLEPTLHDGSVAASADFSITAKDQSLGGALNLTDIHYRDGDRELAGVDRVSIDTMKLAIDSLSVGKIQVDRPHASVTREASGAFSAAGVRVLPAMFAPRDDAGTVPLPATTQPATRPASTPFVVTLDGLHVTDGSLQFVDQFQSTDTTATATLDLQHVAIGKPADPATLSLQAAISGVIDRATIDGTLAIDPTSPGAALTIKADNIRAGQLAKYLPPGIAVPLKDGSFATKLQAGIAPAKAGGQSAKLIVTDLDFHDATQSLAKVGSARAIVSRIDPAANYLSVDELSTAGVELSAAHTVDGGFRVLGVEFGAPATSAPVVASPAAPVLALAPPPTTRAAASVEALVAAAHKTPAVVLLEKLDAKVARLSFTDEQRPAAAPLVIRDLSFRNLATIDWGGVDPDTKTAGKFQLDCAIDPVIGAVTILTTTSPLATQPTLSVDILARDIRGDGLTDLVPELKPDLHGSALAHGEFHSHSDATFRLSRRGLSQIDYMGPIDADLDIKPVTFRATQDGPVLAGVDEVHSDGVHFEPKTGALHVKTVEITKPMGRVSREADGVHVLGVVFQLPGATTQPSTQPTTEPAPTAPVLANPTTAPAQRPTKPAAEVRVDQLVINGLDFVAEDKTVNPPLVVPLNQLDVEVRDFTNFAPYEDRPLKFTALVNADKVRLPKPLASSGIAGALGDAGALLGGKKVETQREFEDRELFAEASANGSIGLFPAPNGYIKTSVGGLELQSLSSLAQTFGINLSNGVFDSTVDARLPGDGSIQTKAKLVITDLSVTEPPNGPIFRYLHLPAPLDAVLGVLRDAEGSITVPLDVPVKNAQLSPEALVGPAIGAFGSIVVTAITNTPLKAGGAVTELLGIGGKKETAPEPPIALTFDAGDVALSAADIAAVKQLRARLIKEPALTLVIKHNLGGGDVKTAESRANPSPQDAQYLAQRIRQQQVAAATLRSQLAGVARSDLQRGASADDTLARLKQVNQQMAQNDEAMDRLFDLLKPGSDRMAARRTRGVSIAYGKQRLAAIQSLLLDKVPPDVADRIHLLTPQFTTPADDAGGIVMVQLIPKKK